MVCVVHHVVTCGACDVAYLAYRTRIPHSLYTSSLGFCLATVALRPSVVQLSTAVAAANSSMLSFPSLFVSYRAICFGLRFSERRAATRPREDADDLVLGQIAVTVCVELSVAALISSISAASFFLLRGNKLSTELSVFLLESAKDNMIQRPYTATSKGSQVAQKWNPSRKVTVNKMCRTAMRMPGRADLDH